MEHVPWLLLIFKSIVSSEARAAQAQVVAAQNQLLLAIISGNQTRINDANTAVTRATDVLTAAPTERAVETTSRIRRQPEIRRRYGLATLYLDKLPDRDLIFLMKVHPELTGLIFQYALLERWPDAAMWTQTREDVVNWQFLMARRVELNRLVKSIQRRPDQGDQELRELTAIALRIEERDLRTAVRTQDRLMDEQARFDPFDRAFFNFAHPWWVQQQNHPGALLWANTRRLLCTLASHDLANRLLAAEIDLSQTPTIVLACGGLNSVTTGGTPWHLAATNRDITFLDFLDNRIHDHIFTPDFNHRLSLDIAMMDDNYEGAQRLIQLGHSLRAPMYRLLQTLPSPNDRYFQLLFNGMGVDINNFHRKSIHSIHGNKRFNLFGPLLHDVVRLVHTVNAPLRTKVAALRQWCVTNRRKVTQQTRPIISVIAVNTAKGVRLIEAIKGGNAAAQGNLQGVDSAGQFAWELGFNLRVSQSIIDLL
ncbi:hypothetical protein BJX62DRAFT_243476 [Aspergillus germanicus]